MTVEQLITGALRLIGVVGAGETPATSERDDAFSALNNLVLSLSAGGVYIPSIKHESFSVTGAVSYTIGSGATFNTARPLLIKAASSINTNATKDLEICSAERWAAVTRDRSRAGKLATHLFCDYANPSATIYLWPTPVTGGTLELSSLKPLSEFSAVSDVIALPPGYERLLRLCLAKEVAPEYPGAVITQALQDQMTEAKEAIAALNAITLGTAPAAAAAA